jgi:hypothetical protein
MIALFASCLLATVVASAKGEYYQVMVSALRHGYREVPVHAVLDAPAGPLTVSVRCGSASVPAQIRRVNGQAKVTWMVRDLGRGETRRYEVMLRHGSPSAMADRVLIARQSGNLEIHIGDELFARYDTTTGPNKPYFHPLFAPGGKRIVRGYPLLQIEGEGKDHPHHRGMWFTHGDVNGQDFWSEGAKAAKTIHREYEEILSGPVYGYFRARTDWIANDGKKIAEDVREVTIYPIAQTYVIDFELTIKAVGGPLIFGDTKEGSFGIRVPDSMRVRGGGGHIMTAAGLRDAEAWGKRAEWVDYYGPVDGETVGVAILDHPSNLRFPTYWHVRDYGLFAANPFGLHDFIRGTPPGAGKLTVPEGKTITFRYRIAFHKGKTDEADIGGLWNAYADPPYIEVR